MAAERKVVSTKGHESTFEISVKDVDKKVTAQFVAPTSPATFKAWVTALSETPPNEGGPSPLQKAWELHMYAADLKARARARESVVADSTIVRKDGREVDLMLLGDGGKADYNRTVAIVNAAYETASIIGGEPSRAFIVARRKLVDDKLATDHNGKLVVARK